VLLIESDQAEADRAAMRIRLDLPDAIVRIARDMSEAAHALEGEEFDLVLYSPMGVSTIGGRRSPITEIATYLAQYKVPVLAITPNLPPPDVRQAIAQAPNMEGITQANFQRVIDMLAEINAKKSSGTTRQNQVELERVKAKLEGLTAQFQELKADVKELAGDNWRQEQALIEARNQLTAIAGTVTDLKQKESCDYTAIDTLKKLVDGLVDSGDRDSKLAIARMDAQSKSRGAAVAAIATILVGLLALFGTPNGVKILDWMIPPRHADPLPKISTPNKK
jgi:hypothetical protein